MFASLRIDFDGAWSVVGGARLSGDSEHVEIKPNVPFLGGDGIEFNTGTDHVVTPYAGVVYALDRHYSLYASYADIYLSQTGVRQQRAPGQLLGPVQGVNVEAGIKGEWRNGALNGSLAVYRIEQSNQAELVSADMVGLECCYYGVTSKAKGVDTEIGGEALPGWNIGLGYTYNDRESPPSHPLSPETPKHLLKAWTNLRLSGALDRWQIGGSVHAQSETTSQDYTFCSDFECGTVRRVQPAYAVFDLRAAFDVDRNWQVALSVNNVLDKVYYQTLDFYAWYGEPRNWVLRINGRY